MAGAGKGKKRISVTLTDELYAEFAEFCEFNSIDLSKRMKKYILSDIQAWRKRKADLKRRNEEKNQ